MPRRLTETERRLTGSHAAAHNYPRCAPHKPAMPDFYRLLGDRRAAQDARREWERTIPDLDRLGLLARIDGFLCEDLCVTVARIRQAERAISAEGLMVAAAGRPDRGMVRHPLLVALNQYRAHYQKLARLLGIGPASRQTLDVPERDNEFALSDLQKRNLSDLAEQHFGHGINWSDADWELDFSDTELDQIETWRAQITAR